MFGIVSFLIAISFIHCLVQEAPDGSVCFNQCSGHGDCIDYSCHCFIGYHGDDCSTTFADENNLIPILTAGHFNVTRKNFTQVLSKNSVILVGFSSYNCHRCIQAEPQYANLTLTLSQMKIPFARGNVDQMKSIAKEVGATELPALVLFKKMRPLLYRGFHLHDPILAFVNKQNKSPVTLLRSIDDVTKFLESRNEYDSLSTVMVVAFFSEYEDIEEDDYDEYKEIAKELQSNEDIYFGVVTNSKISKHFKQQKLIDRTPSIVLTGDSFTKKSINMDELYGESQGMKGWIIKNSIPLVGKVIPTNFALYEKIGLPMLMLFLDLTDEQMSSQPGKIVGGKSGGLLNEILIDEFKKAAQEHIDRILFVYLDGTKHEDQMKSLGLYGGKERLPSIAFNTRMGQQIPFPEELPINSDTILQFCADFISGKLKSAKDAQEMAKKALQAAKPINTKNKAIRKEIKLPPEQVRGVSEQFGDGAAGDHSAVKVTRQNFDEIVMNDDKDVVLLLHAQSCESCANFAVYFKRMALRFQELNLPSLTIARMDITYEAPPPELNLLVGPLPLLLMIPANAKYPPWTFYSGVGKIQPMMKWIHEQSSIPFELPNLPHLSEKDKIAYKEQVREREIALDKKRTEEKRAMEKEDQMRAEFERKKRKAAKQKLLYEQKATTDHGKVDFALEDHDEF